MCPVVYGKAILGAVGNLTEAGVDEAIDAILEHHHVEVDTRGGSLVVQRQEFLHQALVGFRQPLLPLKNTDHRLVDD